MSKYGTINSNPSQLFTSDQIQHFADEHGLTYDRAESIARNYCYRKNYRKARNHDPIVKAKRKAANKKQQAQMKAFTAFVR